MPREVSVAGAGSAAIPAVGERTFRLLLSHAHENAVAVEARPLLNVFTVPEISRFFGIVIRMFTEAGAQHHTPHFHASYQGHVAVFGVDPIDLIAGEMPRPQRRLIEAWAELHNAELQADWVRLQAGQPALPIDPLQ